MALTQPAPDMWDKVLKAFRQTLDKAEATYLTKAKSAYAVTALAYTY